MSTVGDPEPAPTHPLALVNGTDGLSDITRMQRRSHFDDRQVAENGIDQQLAEQPGDPEVLLGTVFDDVAYPTDQMIAVGPVELVSICEHHLLPFTGHAWVGYVPSGNQVVGLSKLARLVDHYARRPQVQERLTTQIVEALEEYLEPLGAGCVIRASHACMALRGVRKTQALMVTSVLRGVMRNDAAARAEFMDLSHGGR